jgi:uncharacterized protein
MEEAPTYTAFLDETLIASGPLNATLPIVKASFDRDAGALVLIFEDQTGRQVDFDLRGSLNEVLERALPARPAAARSGPGRPKLGVVSREVSLLPRHWDWLEQQPNGASAALRRLVDEARNRNPGEQRARLATEAVGRFLSALAGNLPGYEEASRALYAGNRARVEDLIQRWPADIRAYLMRRLDDALGPAAGLPGRV